jgi:hypothetical protein
VMHYDAPVSGRVNVQLHPVGIEHHGSAKGGPGVFVFVS